MTQIKPNIIQKWEKVNRKSRAGVVHTKYVPRYYGTIIQGENRQNRRIRLAIERKKKK